VPQLRFLHVLLGDEAELSPEAKFYERLLAMDLNEAHAIADRFLERRPLIDFYDTVLLPALGLIEQDRHKGAFDDTRGTYLLLSATELVAELSEYKSAASETSAQKESVAITKALTGKDVQEETSETPTGCAIICIPAGDQADELTAMMLAQLLEQGHHHTMLLPTGSVTTEVLERLAQDPATILCISAMPPFVFTQTRALCQNLRQHLPQNRIMVGMWQSPQDPEVLRERLGSAAPDLVTTTLAAAVAHIEEWEQSRQDEDEAAALQRVTAE
jgi:hypothetical protein